MASVSTSTHVHIDPLEGSSNYEDWKRVIEAVLIREDVLEIVTGESKEPELPPEPTPSSSTSGTENTPLEMVTPAPQLSAEARAELNKAHTAWKRSCRRAYATLTLAISPAVRQLLTGIEDPHEIWTKLMELYAPKGRAAKHM